MRTLPEIQLAADALTQEQKLELLGSIAAQLGTQLQTDPMLIQFRRMTRSQQLKLMEQLWTELTQDQEQFESPSWHASELAATEAAIQSGQVQFIDWEVVKRNLREKTE